MHSFLYELCIPSCMSYAFLPVWVMHACDYSFSPVCSDIILPCALTSYSPEFRKMGTEREVQEVELREAESRVVEWYVSRWLQLDQLTQISGRDCNELAWPCNAQWIFAKTVFRWNTVKHSQTQSNTVKHRNTKTQSLVFIKFLCYYSLLSKHSDNSDFFAKKLYNW